MASKRALRCGVFMTVCYSSGLGGLRSGHLHRLCEAARHPFKQRHWALVHKGFGSYFVVDGKWAYQTGFGPGLAWSLEYAFLVLLRALLLGFELAGLFLNHFEQQGDDGGGNERYE